MGKHVVIREKDRDMAKEILAGKPIYEVLIANGYSPKWARQGKAALSKAIQSAMLEQGGRFEWMGARLLENPQLIENSVVGWLYQAMIDGRSKGVTAAKLLGTHRRVDMFASDAQQNILVIQAPSDWKAPNVTYEPEQQEPALPPAQADLPEYE
jgi:hypothetical protein